MKKRKDGRYCKNVFIGYQPDGKRKFKTIYGKTQKEVEEQEREIKNQLDLGVKTFDNITIGEWADEWFNAFKANTSYNTQYMYAAVLKNHIQPKLGNIMVADIKTIQIQKFLNEIVKEGKTRTAEICKLTIKQFMKQAQIDGLISRDVTAGVQPIRSHAEEKRCLSDFELKAIKNADLTDKQRIFLDVMRYAGLRRGEALALTIADIDFETNKINVNKSLMFERNKGVIKEPKSKAGYRKVPLPNKLSNELKQYIHQLNGIQLFPMTKGGYMSMSSFNKFWEGIMKAVKLSADRINSNNKLRLADEEITFTPHIFRHTYATNLYYAGVDVKTAQYFLGHSSLEMTLGIYTHLQKESGDHAAVDKINAYLEAMAN